MLGDGRADEVQCLEDQGVNNYQLYLIIQLSQFVQTEGMTE